ncbi:hypothetical protein [Amycolatopsis japonica]|uniref:hypothetical protein n=1 Tax=Amycolatopsis japonica TaxID=208439 RepID=UPI0033C096A6
MHEDWRRWAGAAGTATVIGAIALTIFSIAFKKDIAWWAAWGQWVGGIGSIAAAAAAVWVALEGWRRSERQIADQTKRLDEETARAQASKVAAWINTTREDNENVVVMARNSSDLPVFDVELTIQLGDVVTEIPTPVHPQPLKHSIPTFAPGEKVPSLGELHYSINATVSNIAIDCAKQARTFDQNSRQQLLAILDMTTDAKISMTFRDCEGRQWLRDTSGRLSPQSPN